MATSSLPTIELRTGTAVTISRGILAGTAGEIIEVQDQAATVQVRVLGEHIILKVDTRMLQTVAAAF